MYIWVRQTVVSLFHCREHTIDNTNDFNSNFFRCESVLCAEWEPHLPCIKCYYGVQHHF